MLIVQQGGQEARLAEPVPLHKFHARENLPGAVDQFGGHGRSAVRDPLQGRHVIPRQVRELGQHVDHRRHQHRVGDAVALDRLAEALRAELWDRDLAGAESRRREQEREVRDVEHRRRVEEDTAFLVGHPVVEEVDVREDICVSQRDALRAPGRAARVDQGQDQVRVVNGLGAGPARSAQGLFVEYQLPRNPHGRGRQ